MTPMKNPQHARFTTSSLIRGLTAAESGQGTLELALCLPLFALLVLASAEIGNIAWASVQINNAARAGAAYASASRTNSASFTNIGLAAQNEAPSYITNPALQVTSSQACSCVNSGGSSASIICDSNAVSNCPSPSVIQVAVQVNVAVPVTPIVHYTGLPASYTVSAQATMNVLQ
jgi:Flp pilus assembly protein TadG